MIMFIELMEIIFKNSHTYVRSLHTKKAKKGYKTSLTGVNVELMKLGPDYKKILRLSYFH